MSRLRERMITSLQVEVLGEDHETESCGRLRINNTQGSVFVVQKDKEIQEWREQKNLKHYQVSAEESCEEEVKQKRQGRG